MISENLAKSDLFRKVEISYLNNLIQKCTTVHLDDGEFLFHQGDQGKGMYIIAEGGVEVVLELKEGEKIIATLGEDEFFGEVCMLKPQPRIAGVRAKGKSKLYYLNNQQFERHAEENNPNALRIAFNIAQTLVERLKNANEILAAFEEGGEQGGTVKQREVDHFKKQLLEEGHF